MRALISSLIVASLLTYSFTIFAAPQKEFQVQLDKDVHGDVHQLKLDVNSAINDIEILRRDQINYRIEKDILKEAYSSNLQVIDKAITIALAVIGVFGYLGLRSIKELKFDYTKELDDLKKLKINFEVELQSFVNKQKEFEIKIVDLAATNEKQDNRLKVLELTEKVGELIRNKQWKWALQYIPVGLEIDPNNIPLLTQKSFCHGQMGEFTSAIDACKKIIELEPKNSQTKANLLEYLAISGQKIEFENSYATYKAEIDQFASQFVNGSLIDYFKILLSLVTGDLKTSISNLDAFMKQYPVVGTRKHFENWSFDEVHNSALKFPPGSQKDLLVTTVQYFNGTLASENFVTYLAQLKID